MIMFLCHLVQGAFIASDTHVLGQFYIQSQKNSQDQKDNKQKQESYP
jgi:hypothetical protein